MCDNRSNLYVIWPDCNRITFSMSTIKQKKAEKNGKC
jgi:hypothetical protein